MKVPWMSRKAIASKASQLVKDFRERAGYPVRPPIPADEIIERSLGLTLRFVDLERILGSRDALGATYVESRLVCINERLFEQGPEGRLVFTCAHEAGHWVLHRPYALAGAYGDAKDRAIVCRLRDAREPIEWQADYFAACLLMPEEEVRQAFDRICGPDPLVLKPAAPEERGGEEPRLEHWPIIAGAMCEAGGFSNVSKQAMILRLQEIGLLINETGTRLDWDAIPAEE